MPRVVGRLKGLSVSRQKKRGRHADGGGLYLQVNKDGARSWIFRFSLGRVRELGLGGYPAISLKQARDLAGDARLLVKRGEDPIEARRSNIQAARAERAKRVTFKQAAEQYIESHRAGWRNEKHVAQWTATLETYAYPVIGNLWVGEIETSHVSKILEPIWTTKTDTASRVRGRIENVLDWAASRRYRQGDNPARWKGHFSNLLAPKNKVRRKQHQPAMPFSELPSFMANLRDMDSVSARALEFTILTCARTGATTGGLWTEIDLVNAVWTVPGARAGTKLRQDEHRVPLSKRAVQILRELPRLEGNDHIFPGAKDGRGLSTMAMLECLQGRYPDLTVHGFRSSFKDWASEATNHPDIVSEMALAHVIKGEVQAAYRRGELLEKRKKLMEAWTRYCGSPVITARSDNVALFPVAK